MLGCRRRRAAQRPQRNANARCDRMKAGLTPDRIGQLVREWGYPSGLSCAALTLVNPLEFVSATVTPQNRQRLEATVRPLDLTDLADECQHPFAKIVPERSRAGAVVGWRIETHEGRHRMIALARAGIRAVPIVVYRHGAVDDFGAVVSGQTLLPQRFESGTAEHGLAIGEAISITAANRPRLAEAFGDGNVWFGRPPADIERATAALRERVRA